MSASDPNAVAQALAEGYAAAVRARDLDAFLALYADEVLIFDAWNRFSLQGAPAWRDAVRQWFDSLGEDQPEATVRLLGALGGADQVTIAAFVTYGARDAHGELLRSLDNRLTWLVLREGERWRIVHEHTSVPLDPATAKGLMQLPPEASA